MHPLAVEKFKNAERAFFVIEGCIKADAILSQGEAVLSVPSVTLWYAPELREVAMRYLREKTVVIVPDSDWHENPAVLTQAMYLRTFLRSMGMRAIVAAPPSTPAGGKQGVDDFLAGDGNLDDLVVIDRELPEGVRVWLEENLDRRKDGNGRNETALRNISLHAGEDGTISTSLRTLAKVMHVHHSQVQRAVEDLIECGAVEVDVPLETQSGVWRGSYYDRSLEWCERPTITVRTELRAIKVPHIKLGEWSKEVTWHTRWDYGTGQPTDRYGETNMSQAIIEAVRQEGEKTRAVVEELFGVVLAERGETPGEAAERILEDGPEIFPQ